MTLYFTPPVVRAVPSTLPERHPGNDLFRFYGPRSEGVNVYLMPGNLLTEQDPYSDLEALRVFHGGHIHPVTAAEAALLTAAGYTVVDMPDAPPIIPPTGTPTTGFTDTFRDVFA